MPPPTSFSMWSGRLTDAADVPCGDCVACCTVESGFYGDADCPQLDRSLPGCKAYSQRPDGCRRFDCRAYVRHAGVVGGPVFNAGVERMEGPSAVIWDYMRRCQNGT
jgi:hypothetical protein